MWCSVVCGRRYTEKAVCSEKNAEGKQALLPKCICEDTIMSLGLDQGALAACFTCACMSKCVRV